MATGIGLTQIILNIANFLTGQAGITLIIIAVIIGGLRGALTHHWNQVWGAIFGGAIAISGAWIVTTFLGATAGGG